MKPHRAEGVPSIPEIERLPVDPETGAPILLENPGYYPGYSTLAQENFWEGATRKLVQKRVHDVPPIRFFNSEEARLMDVVCEHIVPQDDRTPNRKIPILPFIDERLLAGATPGYRFADMPPDGDAYRLGIHAINQIALKQNARLFLALSWHEQDNLLKSIHDGTPMSGAEEIWAAMPASRYWALVVQDCVEVYYAHPWAWDEIGYGGPAYPRAYMRLERGEPEPWEVEERRYEWEAPSVSVSDPESEVAAHKEYAHMGQGGTH